MVQLSIFTIVGDLSVKSGTNGWTKIIDKFAKETHPRCLRLETCSHLFIPFLLVCFYANGRAADPFAPDTTILMSRQCEGDDAPEVWYVSKLADGSMFAWGPCGKVVRLKYLLQSAVVRVFQGFCFRIFSKSPCCA
jgi:hypothetical protein